VSSGLAESESDALVVARASTDHVDLACRRAGRLVELGVVQLRVPAVTGEQLGVRAALDDPARFQHQDLIGRADRGEPVRDHPLVGRRALGALADVGSAVPLRRLRVGTAERP
jgi:hypothetical protein